MRYLCCGAALVATLIALPDAVVAQGGTAYQPISTTISAGLVNVAGNNSLTTISGDEKLTYTTADSLWKLGQTFAAVYARSEDSTTASSFKADGRLDRFLSERLSAFVGAGWERNRFAGIARRFEEIVGLAFQALALERDRLALEGGASFNQQQNTAGVDDNFIAARGAADYRHLFTEKAYFQQLAEVLPNLETSEDLRINTETSLVAPLSNAVALKLSYKIAFDNLPEPGFEKTDRTFSSSVQVTF